MLAVLILPPTTSFLEEGSVGNKGTNLLSRPDREGCLSTEEILLKASPPHGFPEYI